MTKLSLPMRSLFAALSVSLLAGVAAPLLAKEDLGIFSGWAAFRDEDPVRCYAIARPAASRLQRDFEPFATIATWPTRKIRGQVHFRLSRRLKPGSSITLTLGRERFELVGRTGDAWGADKRMDAQIVANMRSARSMVIRAVDAQGRRFSNTYALQGAATAMDTATVACAKG